MILLSHPTGNEFVRATLDAFDRAGILCEFWTTLSWNSKSPINLALPRRLREILQRRSFPATIRARTRTIPRREMIRLFAGTIGLASKIEPHAAVDSIYAYEDGALESFRAARDGGFKRIYDLPIAYWQISRRLLLEEAERYPDWEPTLGATRDSDEKLSRKTQELQLANLVVCPSRFVLESLPPEACAQKQCLIAPFGSPDVDLRNAAGRSSGRLRVLFAGALTQRKGLADLFAAMRLVNSKQIELVVMGSLLCPLSWYRDRLADFIYEPPRPHGEVLRLMQSCDVFILPSIVEGRALVQQEAMACGIPVIATKNAGADDVIVDGETGFLVPIRSPEALAEKMSWCVANRSLVDGMGIAARKRAAEFSWRAYGESIVAAVRALTCQ